MKYWKGKPCLFCAKPLESYQTTDAHCGCHGWRMHIDCLKKIAEIRNEKAIIKLRKEMTYIRTWTVEWGEISVYA